MKKHATQTTLLCSVCGNIFPQIHASDSRKKTYNINKLYCPICKKETEHYETKDWYISYVEILNKDNSSRTDIENNIYKLLEKRR